MEVAGTLKAYRGCSVTAPDFWRLKWVLVNLSSASAFGFRRAMLVGRTL